MTVRPPAPRDVPTEQDQRFDVHRPGQPIPPADSALNARCSPGDLLPDAVPHGQRVLPVSRPESRRSPGPLAGPSGERADPVPCHHLRCPQVSEHAPDYHPFGVSDLRGSSCRIPFLLKSSFSAFTGSVNRPEVSAGPTARPWLLSDSNLLDLHRLGKSFHHLAYTSPLKDIFRTLSLCIYRETESRDPNT